MIRRKLERALWYVRRMIINEKNHSELSESVSRSKWKYCIFHCESDECLTPHKFKTISCLFLSKCSFIIIPPEYHTPISILYFLMWSNIKDSEKSAVTVVCNISCKF
jgi:hypothetical protein